MKQDNLEIQQAVKVRQVIPSDAEKKRCVSCKLELIKVYTGDEVLAVVKNERVNLVKKYGSKNQFILGCIKCSYAEEPEIIDRYLDYEVYREEKREEDEKPKPKRKIKPREEPR